MNVFLAEAIIFNGLGVDGLKHFYLPDKEDNLAPYKELEQSVQSYPLLNFSSK